jgi:hypothetical protein
MVTVRQYGVDNTTVRWINTMIRWWQSIVLSYCTCLLLPSYCRILIIVLSYCYHRTVTIVLSYCHHRTVVLSPSYCRIVTSVLSYSHHRTVVLSPSFCRLPVKHVQTLYSTLLARNRYSIKEHLSRKSKLTESKAIYINKEFYDKKVHLCLHYLFFNRKA